MKKTGRQSKGKISSSSRSSTSSGSASRGRNGGSLLKEMVSVVSAGVHKVSEALGSSDDSVDAMDLLKAQHRAVDKLFARVEESHGAERTAAFNELADLLTMHASIEEQIFYPNVNMPATEDLLLESTEEHLAMKRSLADLVACRDTASDEFDAKLKVLQEQVHHHAIKEEEGKLFPILRSSMDRDLMAALANEMIALMVDMMEAGNARSMVAQETDEAAPI